MRQKVEGGKLPKSFYEVNIYPSVNDIMRKEKYLHEHICRNPQQRISRSNLAVYKNESTS